MIAFYSNNYNNCTLINVDPDLRRLRCCPLNNDSWYNARIVDTTFWYPLSCIIYMYPLIIFKITSSIGFQHIHANIDDKCITKIDFFLKIKNVVVVSDMSDKTIEYPSNICVLMIDYCSRVCLFVNPCQLQKYYNNSVGYILVDDN